MKPFESGKILKTDFGAPIKIINYLASGGQGDVYLVEYKGKKKALKWYRNIGNNPAAFYENLKHNIQKGSPDKAFLWPEAITKKYKENFGYIMNLRPEGYYELSEFMLARDVKFSSFRTAVEACIRITSAFRILHNNGCSYQDINDGNFFINPKTGDVLICDNDNVAPNGTNMGIIGKQRYMAPEIVCRHALPNTQTDRFSLSIILFLILFMNHPFEGKKSLVPCLTPLEAEKLYGSEALFIYDPQNKANAPVKNIHVNVSARWEFMPDYIKEAFVKAFSQTSIKEPNKRLRELDWLKVFVRFRSNIVKCTCGNEIFIKNAYTTMCDGCGKNIIIKQVIKLPDYTIAAVSGSRIYRCQLGICNAGEALNPVALVVSKNNNPSILGLKNMTTNILSAKELNGNVHQIHPQEILPIKKGIEVEIYGNKIYFI